jgi:hypothetical protein
VVATIERGQRSGDANTPDVIDAAEWLAMPQAQAMTEVGIATEADYRRVYNEVEKVVYARDNRRSQSGVHVPVVLKRRGARVSNVL